MDQPAGVCAKCGKQAEGVKRCSACFEVSYCSRECQTADWQQHKPQCKKVKLFDVYKGSPLLALANFLPHNSILNPAIYYRVTRKRLAGGKLHLYLADRADEPRVGPSFDLTPGPVSGQLLSSLVMQDGLAVGKAVGILVALHMALTEYNAQHEGSKKIKLSCKGKEITGYSVCVGSHDADHELVYHYDGQTKQLSDRNNHAWITFSTGSKDAVTVDANAAPFGMMLGADVLRYVPTHSLADQFFTQMGLMSRQPTSFWAPLFVVNRQDVRRVDRHAVEIGSQQGVFNSCWVERYRVSVSGRDTSDEDTLLSEVLAEALRVPLASVPEDQMTYCQQWFVQGVNVFLHCFEEEGFLRFPEEILRGVPPGVQI